MQQSQQLQKTQAVNKPAKAEGQQIGRDIAKREAEKQRATARQCKRFFAYK